MAILGIDLGTTNSLAAIWHDGQAVLIPNAAESFLTPSVVSLDDDGSIIVGQTAKKRLASHPDKTAAQFKQWMGTSKTYKLGDQTFKPEELSSFILRSLKKDAEDFLRIKIKEAIISVPAYFNAKQRAATKAAGLLAGLKVERILNEPSAAALAYRRHGINDGTNLVFDFGGGTLDVSILDSFGNIVDILAVAGHNQLGGNDIDEAVSLAFLAQNPELKDKKASASQLNLLRQAAENCKISLTDNPQATMIFDHNGGEYAMTLNSAALADICAPMLSEFSTVIKRAVQNAEKTLGMIDNVILVGGSCRMPLVKDYLKRVTNKPAVDLIDPDMVVAMGLGVAAGIKERNHDVRDMVLMDVCPFSLGVNCCYEGKIDDRFSIIIQRNTPLPASRTQTYSTKNDYQKVVAFKVYQGESLTASDNLLMGEYKINVPPLPAGEATVDVRFTYDINGILDIDFKCNETGKITNKIIIDGEFSESELNQRLEELSRIKINPRELTRNTMLIARGQRLFEGFSGNAQQRIEALQLRFEIALKERKPAEIEKTYQILDNYFNELEAYSDNLLYEHDDEHMENT